MRNLATIASRGRQWILTPYFFGQLFTAAKSFEANPLLGSARLNAWGLHKTRVAVAYRLAERRRAKLRKFVSDEARKAYERDGFVVRRNFLPKSVFEQLLVQVKEYRGASEERLWGDTVNRKIVIDSATASKLPAFKEVLNSSDWRNLIAYVGGCSSPPLVYIQTLYRQGGVSDPQTRLHSDTFHSTAKAWLFLTDVRENEGAFTYVRGSHKLTAEKLDWQYRTSLQARESKDKETREGSFRIEVSELRALGLSEPVQLAVPANTLVVADTSGFHARGPSIAGTLRVEIWALGRRQPFLTWGGVEPWTSETLGSLVSTSQGLRDYLKMKSPQWSSRVGVSAFDLGAQADPQPPLQGETFVKADHLDEIES
jgi:hypothetical protein